MKKHLAPKDVDMAKSELGACIQQRKTIRLLVVSAEERLRKMEEKARCLVAEGAKGVFPDVTDITSTPLLPRLAPYENMLSNAQYLKRAAHMSKKASSGSCSPDQLFRSHSSNVLSTSPYRVNSPISPLERTAELSMDGHGSTRPGSPNRCASPFEVDATSSSRSLECAAWAVGVDYLLLRQIRGVTKRFASSVCMVMSHPSRDQYALNVIGRCDRLGDQVAPSLFDPTETPPISPDDVDAVINTRFPYTDLVLLFPPPFLVGCPPSLYSDTNRPRSDFKEPYIQVNEESTSSDQVKEELLPHQSHPQEVRSLSCAGSVSRTVSGASNCSASTSCYVDPRNEFAVATAITNRYNELKEEITSLLEFDSAEYTKMKTLMTFIEKHRLSTTSDVGVQVHTPAIVHAVRSPRATVPSRLPLWLHFIDPQNTDRRVLEARHQLKAAYEAGDIVPPQLLQDAHVDDEHGSYEADDVLVCRLEGLMCQEMEKRAASRQRMQNQYQELDAALDAAASTHSSMLLRTRELLAEVGRLKEEKEALQVENSHLSRENNELKEALPTSVAPIDEERVVDHGESDRVIVAPEPVTFNIECDTSASTPCEPLPSPGAERDFPPPPPLHSQLQRIDSGITSGEVVVPAYHSTSVSPVNDYPPSSPINTLSPIITATIPIESSNSPLLPVSARDKLLRYIEATDEEEAYSRFSSHARPNMTTASFAPRSSSATDAKRDFESVSAEPLRRSSSSPNRPAPVLRPSHSRAASAARLFAVSDDSSNDGKADEMEEDVEPTSSPPPVPSPLGSIKGATMPSGTDGACVEEGEMWLSGSVDVLPPMYDDASSPLAHPKPIVPSRSPPVVKSRSRSSSGPSKSRSRSRIGSRAPTPL